MNNTRKLVEDWNSNFRYITIHPLTSVIAPKDRVIKLGINWSGMGTKNTEETIAFIKDLEAALRIVQFCNAKAITIEEWSE
jgi:hypothetical protein